MRRLLWLAPVAALLLAVSVQPASALVLSLGAGNPAINGYTGPYGSVTVTLVDATHAKLVFDSNTVGGNIYLFGDGASVAANFNGAVTLGTVTGSNAGVGFSPGPFSDGGSSNVDGWNTFNQTVNSFDGFTHASDHIEMNVTKNSGSWASENDILVANAAGKSVAAHIFVTSSPADASNGALATGYAADGTPPPSVPEPSSMLLLGMGLLGSGAVGFIRRRRK